MSAPSSRFEAATYGISIAWPVNGTLTTQNVVTTPRSDSSTSCSVGTPSVGHEPRGGM